MTGTMHPLELSIEALRTVYRNGVLEILARLEHLVARERDDAAARAALQGAKGILAELDEYADGWIEENIPQEYRRGWDGAFDPTLYAAATGELRGAVNYESFTKLHRSAIEVVAYNLQDAVRAATATMGRKMDDVFRRVGLEATMKRLFTGEAIRETVGAMKEQLVLSGLDSFKDKAGRTWRLDSYCTMVARTTTREATTQGTINRAYAGGHDLILVSEHHPTCEICAPLGGKVFSLSGQDGRYPVWNDYIPAHPNCRHNIGVYIREYDDRADWREEYSRQPLDVDNRSEAEKKAYDATQTGNRQQNELRRQYERYVARLGTDNVGTIQSFARSKRAESARWQELQDLYRDAGRVIKAGDVAKHATVDLEDLLSREYRRDLLRTKAPKEAAVAMLEAHGDQYSKIVGEKEIKAIERYRSGTGYPVLNGHLRGESREISADDLRKLKDLKSLTERATIETDIVAVRGMPEKYLSDNGWKGVQKNDIIRDDGFMSLSLQNSVGEAFMNQYEEKGVLMTLKIPRGAHGVSVDAATKLAWESELILKPGTEILVTGKKTVKGVRVLEGVVIGG